MNDQSSVGSVARSGSLWRLNLLAAICAATVPAEAANRQDEADVRAIVVEAIERMGEDLQWKWQLKKGPPWPREKGPPRSPSTHHILALL